MILGTFKPPNFPVTFPSLKTKFLLSLMGSESPQPPAVPGVFAVEGERDGEFKGFHACLGTSIP